jgi:predicted ATP-grasp superfamily ATP-dependent carboligase
VSRPVVVLGLLWAGLSVARSLGRAGLEVTGISMHPHEFGLRSRYLRHRALAIGSDEEVLRAIRAAAANGRPVLFPERDDHVELVLRHWDEVTELADVPMPPDPDVARRLRHKETLPAEAAKAGLSAPRTVPAPTEEAVRALDLRPPLLIKPFEGEHFAGTFGQKVMVAEDLDAAVSAWRRAHEAGFETVVQELVPGAEENIWSLFAYIGRDGSPLASVVGRKIRQGPLHFGTSAVFEVDFEPRVEELGLRLLESAGYRGFGHVEFARDARDGTFQLLEVNTRMPMWAGVAMSRWFDLARLAYDDLCGAPADGLRRFEERVSWIFFAKDAHVSLQMARERGLGPRAFLRPYASPRKVRAVFAADDPLPALAQVAYLRSRLL